MNFGKITSAGMIAATLAFSHMASAQIEGVYVSDGSDECRVTITEINIDPPRFGDAFYRIASRGVAACMWDGVGLATSTNLAGAYVSLPPINNRVYITAKWLFGAASPQIEIEQRNSDGEHILTRTYTRQ